MNWLAILITAFISIGSSELLIGDIASKTVVLIVAILIFAFMWACYGLYVVAGG